MSDGARVPRSDVDDYTHEMAARRRAFVAERTGVELHHVPRFSLEPGQVAGNVENFIGVAQVPIGLAGPLRIDGEHAQGDFYVPLATSEGTLVASYSRGMRVLTESGGVKTTIVKRAMQRAPVFLMADAREARALVEWMAERFDEIKQAAEATTRKGRLTDIDPYIVGNLVYARFNFTTADAAGQNMTGKATSVACEWIRAHHPRHPPCLLSGGIDTDKKHSAMNAIRTRGRRVVAEAVIKRDVLERVMRVDPAALFRARQVSNVGALLAGSAYNGPHSANGLAALFIATGQDAANVSESHAGITYAQVLESGDYYWSVTMPALIVATYGGGTGLPTQRECLEILGCYGQGRADAFAEVAAAVVLAGDISLASAVVAGDWVSSHERLGRNRP